MIELVCASHNREVLKQNLLKSDIVQSYPLNIVKNYTNIPAAYNAVKLNEGTKYVIYVHHDVFLYTLFEKELLTALKHAPPDWGVLGLAGVRLEDNRRVTVGHILDRGKSWGQPINGYFAMVDTLDELILITRGDLKFDEQFEQDYYGADICMQAKARGQQCYVFKSFCDHNSSRPPGGRTDSFYVSQQRFKEKWMDWLPIATTCALLT